MGRVKALLPHPDGSGRTLVRAAAETLLAAGLRPVVVVLGHARREVACELRIFDATIRAVANPDYRGGMLSSLKAGVRALAADPEVRWALIALVDQPSLSRDLVRRLAAAADAPIPGRETSAVAIAPADPARRRAGLHGHPVLLSHRLFDEVLAEQPQTPDDADRGARRVLRRHREAIVTVPAEPQELATVETAADYEGLKRGRRLSHGP